MIDELRTDRLLLRRWRPQDREPFAAVNSDPLVMEHFPSPLSRQESDALIDRLEAGFVERGWGLWAVEAPEGFVGFTGLSVPTFEAPFLPSVEVGWRLARWAWGRGYACEAATAVLDAAFGSLALPEVVSFTATTNTRSVRLMQRLGLAAAGTFEHPRLPVGDVLRLHVLYRADAASWSRPAAAR